METYDQSQEQSDASQNASELYNVYYQHVQNLRNSQNDELFRQIHGHPNHTEQSPYGQHGLNDPNLYQPIINANYNIQNLRRYAHVYNNYANSRYANTCTYMISQEFPHQYNRDRYRNTPYLLHQNNQNHQVDELPFFDSFRYRSPLGNHVINNEYLLYFYSVLYYHMQKLKISDQKIQQNVAKPHVSDDKLYLTFGTEFMYCRSHRNYSSDSRIWARNAYETCYFSKLTLGERLERINTPKANNPFSDQVKVSEWIPVDLSFLTEENNDVIPKSKPSATKTNEGHISTPDASVKANNRDATPKHTATASKNCSTQIKAPEVQIEKSDGVVSHPTIAEIDEDDWIFEIVPPSEVDKNYPDQNIRINFDHSIFKPKAPIQTKNSTSSTSTSIPSQQKKEKKRFPKREKQYEDYELPIPEIDPADYEGRKSPDPLELLEIVLNNRISSMPMWNDELPPEFVPNQPWPEVKNLIDNSHGVNDSKDNSNVVNDSKDNSNIVKDLNYELPPAFVPNQPWPGVKNLIDNSHGVNDSKDNSNVVNDSKDNSNIVKDLNYELPPAFVPNQPWPGVKNLIDNSHGVKNLIDNSHGVNDLKDNSNIVKDSINSSHGVNVSIDNSYDPNRRGRKRKRFPMYFYNQNNNKNALVDNRTSRDQSPIPCWELAEVEHLRQTLLEIPKPQLKCTNHPNGCPIDRYPLYNRYGSKREHLPRRGRPKRAITKRNF